MQFFFAFSHFSHFQHCPIFSKQFIMSAENNWNDLISPSYRIVQLNEGNQDADDYFCDPETRGKLKPAIGSDQGVGLELSVDSKTHTDRRSRMEDIFSALSAVEGLVKNGDIILEPRPAETEPAKTGPGLAETEPDNLSRTRRFFLPKVGGGILTASEGKYPTIYRTDLDPNKLQIDTFLLNMNIRSHLSSSVYCLKLPSCKNFEKTVVVSDGSEIDILGERQIGVFVTYDSSNHIIRVVYRGTVSMSQWIGNLVISSYKCGDNFGKAHRGFVSMYLGTRQQVWKRVKNLMEQYPGNKGIEFTGHSLGGALALLAACDFKKGIKVITIENKQYAASTLFPFDPKVELTQEEFRALNPNFIVTHVEDFQSPEYTTLYTYGQPRVGDQLFADNVKKLFPPHTYYRIVHGEDIVSSLPPEFIGFRSSGTLVHFNAGCADKYEIYEDTEVSQVKSAIDVLLDRDEQMVQDALTPSDPNTQESNSNPDGLSADRKASLMNLVMPSVADHMFYVGVNYSIKHPDLCKIIAPDPPIEPSGKSSCSML
jgi:hypothetical protein